MGIFMKRKLNFRDFLILQAVVIVYTASSVLGKLAAVSAEGENGWGFLLLYGAEIGVLGIYAVLWQQVIRRVELSVAYANRAVALLWSLLWAVFLFGEKITPAQLLGISLVMIGTAVINGGKEAEK
ncbi:MAG: EamA family transporter [Lachnospiraceae bacterium]|nr:EamA family transporter [Lachnospiraceae bacterium]